MRHLTDLDLRLLRIFCTIVDCNGFRNAQIALNMAQSTLSTHVARLESILGTKLCERGRSGFRLTATGEETHLAAIELFRSIDGFQGKMRRVHGREVERLRIGIIDTVSTYTDLDIPAVIAEFVRAWPNVHIDLEIMPHDALQKAVADGRRDIVIGPSFQQTASLTYCPLGVERHHVYCGSRHPWYERDDQTLTREDVLNAQFSVRSYHYFDDVYRLGATGASATVSNMEAQELMLLSGAYIGFLPMHKGRYWCQLAKMRVVKPKEWVMESRFFAAYTESEGRDPLKRSFVDLLQQN